MTMGIPPIPPTTEIAGDEPFSLVVIGIVAVVEFAIWLLVRAFDRNGSAFPPVDADEEATLRRWVEVHRSPSAPA
jgi:hypothetical protein